MTLHPIALNSLIYEENFLSFFISVGGGEVGPGNMYIYNQNLDKMPSS
jgi:hypothetical protein